MNFHRSARCVAIRESSYDDDLGDCTVVDPDRPTTPAADTDGWFVRLVLSQR